MTTLSKEAAKLHDIYHDYMIMRDVPEMTREGWLEIASAALELAGVRVEYAQQNKDSKRIFDYKLSTSMKTSLWLCDGYKPCVLIDLDEQDNRNLDGDEPLELAAILLHAAQTAAAWEGEGK